MKKMTVIRSCFIGVVLLLMGVLAFYGFHAPNTVLPTYFKYSNADSAMLSAHDPSQEITLSVIKKWDTIMFNLIKEHKLGDIYASRIYAYVYSAQRDVAFLTRNANQDFIGSIEPISAAVLCLFFKNSCSSIQDKLSTPPSELLTQATKLVLKQVQARINQENSQKYNYLEKTPFDHYWVGTQPYYGQSVGSWMTWLISSGQTFIAPPPPDWDSPEWTKQLSMVRAALKDITPEQTTSVVFWAGNPSTITPPGIWLSYANEYMSLHKVDMVKFLYIRSVLAMGLADSVITAFNSKYTYWAKRPFMRDPSIRTIMPTPNHPSYPAAHSTLSATAAIILSFYFPENQTQWNNLAFIASEGRVWGGIHFPIDAQQGAILGKKVGDAIIQKEPSLFKDR